MQQKENGTPRSLVTTSLLLTLLLRLFYSAFGVVAAPYLKLDERLIRSNDFTDNLIGRDAGWRHALLGVWERFDTLWYIHIANYGYDRAEAIVFFPLYPLLIRIFTPIAREPIAAALLIATISTFFLFWGFQKLLLLDLPQKDVQRALLLLVVWPPGFIFFAGYAESLLIALTIWAVYFARTGRWRLAGAIGCCAGLTKAAGYCVAAALAILVWREGRAKLRAAWPAALCLLAPLIVTLITKLSGHSLASAAYAKYWRTEIAFPWTTLAASLEQAATTRDAVLILNLGALALIFIPVFVKRLRLEYTLFAAATLALFLAKKTDPLLQSSVRYVLTVFPGFASLAAILKHPFLLALLLVTFVLVNLILLWSFFEWGLIV